MKWIIIPGSESMKSRYGLHIEAEGQDMMEMLVSLRIPISSIVCIIRADLIDPDLLEKLNDVNRKEVA